MSHSQQRNHARDDIIAFEELVPQGRPNMQQNQQVGELAEHLMPEFKSVMGRLHLVGREIG